MANDYVIIDDTNLTNLANAIREKGGTSARLTYPDGMVNAIKAIELKSERKNGVVTSSTSSGIVTLPNITFKKLQLIHLCLLDTDYPDLKRIQTVTMSFSSSNTIDGFSIVAVNEMTGGSSRTKVMTGSSVGDDRYKVTSSKSSSSVTIDVDEGMFGGFYGRYSYEVFGI